MRVLFFLICFGLIVATPFWLYIPVILVGIIIFPFFVEAIVLGAIIDVVYGNSGVLFGFAFAIISAVVVYFVAPLREHLRFNA